MVRVYDKSGYTLIELIVSLAILLIVITPLSGYFLVSADNNQSARAVQEANLLAQSEMERWKQSGVVGDLTPPDVTSGNYVIRRRAILENRDGNGIPTLGSEPVAPVVPRNPDDPLYSVANPIPSSIENYAYPEDQPSGVDATLHLLDDGIIFDSNSKDSGTFSTINLSVNNLTASLDYGAGIRNISLLQGHPDAFDLMIDIQTDTPVRELIALNQNILKDVHVYIYRGNKPGGGLYNEAAFRANPLSERVMVYHNLVRVPQGTNVNRLYRVSVEVFENDNLTAPLVKLDSMIKTK